MKNNKAGFSLIELLLVLVLMGVMLAMAIPAWQQHQLTSGRQQAWLVLQRIGLQQEIWHIQHGHYFEDIDRVMPPVSEESYKYQIDITDEGLLLSATVNANGPQAQDVLCWRLTLADNGRAQSYGKGQGSGNCK
ncbi:MAG: prepilin-type N-terminal cleavage/methylation domain-containing protein [Gammaproteobacteria bacterium]|nr:prepilin-type N-terminal cleavage/methylation domain-containing protein [Gammaproteobacteria bacterium]